MNEALRKTPPTLLSLVLLATMACDPVKILTEGAPTTTNIPPKEEIEPFVIEPKVWGEAGEGAKYEVRELPDGNPGIFASDGSLLLHLMPEMVLDIAPAGKPRPKPSRKKFDLVKLEPNDAGGFSLFGRLEDRNGRFDVRVEAGPGDPRVHVAVTTTYARDVDVHRQIVVFRTGLMNEAAAVDTDYEWKTVDEEWINRVHAPKLVNFGSGAAQVTAMGRFGTDGISAHRLEDGRWDVEVEAYHYENHPVDVGNDCGMTELDGVARFAAGTRGELRADLVLGPSRLPLALRYPDRRRAGVAILGTGTSESGASAVLAAEGAVAPSVEKIADVWVGESLSKLPCDETGRFAALAEAGAQTAWAGDVETDGPNLLAGDEVDARRAIVFTHPNAAPQTSEPLTLLRGASLGPKPAAGWFSEKSLADLRVGWGLTVLRTDVAAVLAADASATNTVSGTLSNSLRDRDVWLAGADELAARMLQVAEVDFDFLPDGVVRVRNPSDDPIEGFSLLLPPDVAAKFPADTLFERGGRVVSFDLPAEGEQLIQLFEKEQPFAAMAPVRIQVVYRNVE